MVRISLVKNNMITKHIVISGSQTTFDNLILQLALNRLK